LVTIVLLEALQKLLALQENTVPLFNLQFLKETVQLVIIVFLEQLLLHLQSLEHMEALFVPQEVIAQPVQLLLSHVLPEHLEQQQEEQHSQAVLTAQQAVTALPLEQLPLLEAALRGSGAL